MQTTVLYKNKKTGDLYEVICDDVIEANNNSTNQKIVVYKHVTTSQLYCRTQKEFNEKFEIYKEEKENTPTAFELPYQSDYYIGAPGTSLNEHDVSTLPGAIDLDDTGTIEWFKQKRDDILEHFKDGILSDSPIDIIERRYQSLLRIQKQLQIVEDALIISKLIKNGPTNLSAEHYK